MSWLRSGVRHIARRSSLPVLLAGLVYCVHAVAGVTPETSRVIFRTGAIEQSLQLYNLNRYPVLVQAWVDDGRLDALPQDSKSPVVVLPPVFRMGVGDQTNLRMISAGANLPTDRESVYWLNLYEIPATPQRAKNTDDVDLTVTMRTQIKVFMRPDKLPYPPIELPKHLAFSLHRTSDALALTVDNPTPYYATIGIVQVKIGDRSQQHQVDMIAPFSSATVQLDALSDAPGDSATLNYTLIGDDGNPIGDERRVSIGSAGASGGAT
ncbi:fimbrial biogenesis chaperone [Paraburkholderia dinghuensis]|uniref:fimbrial biogenesis chaperone n=1 Tax=Paraburkholderia dinghuensis TaxID=2305225 RepID=UPI001FE2CCD8|nr:molecular chaperone [Paraburkholderia dinghuensis]